MARNGLKYQRLDVQRRESARGDWNAPVLWPLLLVGALALVVLAPAWLAWRRKESARGVEGRSTGAVDASGGAA
jgi:hypothetical protein